MLYVCPAKASFAWNGDNCTVTLASVEDGVIVRAASYRGNRLEEVVRLDADTVTATLTGDTVKVFYWTGDLRPVHTAVISKKP